jgi:uncharacterized protein (DUF2141 family)
MSKKILGLGLLLQIGVFATHPIIVTIPEIMTPTATIRAIIFDNETSFNEKKNEVAKLPVSISTSNVTFQFDNIEPGTYAIQLFQDLNMNMKMDKGMLGPKEPYGMSNNPKLMGKPKFKDLAFESQVTTNIIIELKNQ